MFELNLKPVLTEDVHQLDGHESEQAPGEGDGQGSLVCCSPWGHKESDTTERLKRTENLFRLSF